MKTLYVTDLDGTLLDNDSRISSESMQMLNALARAGVMVTPATARTPATVQPLMQGVEQPVYTDPVTGEIRPLPAIVMTGAALWNRQSVEFESCALIPRQQAEAIRNTFAAEGINPFVYCLSGNNFLNVYHSIEMTRRENAFYQERRRLTLKRFHLNQQPTYWNHVVLFFAIGPIEKIKRAAEGLQLVTDCATAWYPDIIMPHTGLIDLYANGVSKAGAVKNLARSVGAKRIVVFGDNLNDLPMMRVADVAVAVDNALDDVKAQADVVIGPNSADSVVKFIAEDSGAL